MRCAEVSWRDVAVTVLFEDAYRIAWCRHQLREMIHAYHGMVAVQCTVALSGPVPFLYIFARKNPDVSLAVLPDIEDALSVGIADCGYISWSLVDDAVEGINTPDAGTYDECAVAKK